MNIQFNVKSGKKFRVAMAKAYDAMHKLNDYKLSRKDRVDALKVILNTNLEDMDNLEKGLSEGILRDYDEIKAESVDLAKKLLLEEKNLADATEAQKKACEEAYGMVPKSLYECAKSGDDSAFNKAFAEWLVANGFDSATEDNVPVLHFGVKKETLRKSCKNGKLSGFMTEKAWVELFIRVLADELLAQKVIDPYKYSYKIEEKSNK